MGPYPTLAGLDRLADLKRADLRPLFRDLMSSPNPDRRAEAIRALAKLPEDAADTRRLRELVSEKEPYSVVVAAVQTLAEWDAGANKDVLLRAARMPSRRENVRSTAFAALAKAKSEDGIRLMVAAASQTENEDLRNATLRAMGQVDASEPQTREALRKALMDSDYWAVFNAAQAVSDRKDKDLLPDLQKVVASPPAGTPEWMKNALSEMAKKLAG
jgi:HEAT repeat protein